MFVVMSLQDVSSVSGEVAESTCELRVVVVSNVVTTKMAVAVGSFLEFSPTHVTLVQQQRRMRCSRSVHLLKIHSVQNIIIPEVTIVHTINSAMYERPSLLAWYLRM